ncbi:hypothetical protein AB0C87_24855 [Actinomadura sp. NPDC048021]|uniref:hypothetical protein n=1 Tax=Actinomadura sp. NPDC048021 TaxID=3155385 RepID=UPI00340DAA4D
MNTPEEIALAVVLFTEVWGELAVSLPDDYSCHMTCTEAEALADVFRAGGQDRTAEMILANHAAHDEPDDLHFQGEE